MRLRKEVTRRLDKDPISPELRQIELEVDSLHKGNPLMGMPFGAAAWYFMAFCEDSVYIHTAKGAIKNVHDGAAFADNLVTHMKNAFSWLRTCCSEGGMPPCAYHPDTYQAAWDLSVLSENYDPFEWAFTWASRGYMELSVRDSLIVPRWEYRKDVTYEAYDHLVKVARLMPTANTADPPPPVVEALKIEGEHFTYQLSPRIISNALQTLDPWLEARYSLPSHWQLSRYSILDFKRVSKCLIALSYIHYSARVLAAQKGCDGLGYASSVFLASASELQNRLVRYSGCPGDVVAAIIEDMTYGNRAISKPDPAIQPLIMLNRGIYAIMPNLLMSSSVERNLTVLMNRLPEERAVYSRLVGDKESLMRQWIMDNLAIPNLRYFSGRIPGGHKATVDLVIISDLEKICLFLELKWFIEPAEVREVIEKSEEIAKGISQVRGLKQAVTEDTLTFFQPLQIDSSYRLVFAVASDSFVGIAAVQDAVVPVLQHRHLVAKAKTLSSLSGLCDWLINRQYLPIEGKHYKIKTQVWKVGRGVCNGMALYLWWTANSCD